MHDRAPQLQSWWKNSKWVKFMNGDWMTTYGLRSYLVGTKNSQYPKDGIREVNKSSFLSHNWLHMTSKSISHVKWKQSTHLTKLILVI